MITRIQKHTQFSQSLLCFLFSIMPIVDSLNGYAVKVIGYTSPLSIGVLYRFIVLVALLAICRNSYSKMGVGFFFVMCATCFVGVTVHQLTGSGNGDLIGELLDITQWLFCPMVTFLIIDIYRAGIIDKSFIIKTLTNIAWLASLTIIVPYIFGLGFTTYRTNGSDGFVGYKAFYIATNGVTVLLSVAFIFSLERVIDELSPAKALQAAATGVSLVLIGTKAALLMVAIAIIALAIIKGSASLLSIFLRILIAVAIILLLAYAGTTLFPKVFDPLTSRMQSHFEKATNFWSFLTSGRIDVVPVYYELMKESKFPILTGLFGLGNILDAYGYCEMDYLDMFFQYGMLGLSFLVYFSLYVIDSTKATRLNIYKILVICLFFYAFIVGHLFTNALASMSFALVALEAFCQANSSYEPDDCKEKSSTLLKSQPYRIWWKR